MNESILFKPNLTNIMFYVEYIELLPSFRLTYDPLTQNNLLSTKGTTTHFSPNLDIQRRTESTFRAELFSKEDVNIALSFVHMSSLHSTVSFLLSYFPLRLRTSIEYN